MVCRPKTSDTHGINVPTTPPQTSAACEKLKAADAAVTPLGVRGVRFCTASTRLPSWLQGPTVCMTYRQGR